MVFFCVSGISSLKEDVFFETHSPSWLDCGTTCLQTSVCHAYNYKENFKDGEINCQLTHKVSHSVFEKVSTEDNDWTFYEVAEERMVSPPNYSDSILHKEFVFCASYHKFHQL